MLEIQEEHCNVKSINRLVFYGHHGRLLGLAFFMNRIIPASGKTRGLTTVSDDLQIAVEFTERGILSLPDITMQVPREEYQYWKLLDEFYSEALGCRMKVWDIDGEVISITEHLDMITMDDVRQLDMVCQIFRGEVVPGRKEKR